MSQGVVKNKQKSKRGWRRGRCQEKLILTVQGSWCRLTRSLYHPHFRLGQTQFQTPPTSPLPHWGFFPSFPSDGVCVYNMYPLFCHPHQCLSQEDVISSRFFHSIFPLFPAQLRDYWVCHPQVIFSKADMRHFSWSCNDCYLTVSLYFVPDIVISNYSSSMKWWCH